MCPLWNVFLYTNCFPSLPLSQCVHTFEALQAISLQNASSIECVLYRMCSRISIECVLYRMRRTFEAKGVSCDDTVDLDGVGVPEIHVVPVSDTSE